MDEIKVVAEHVYFKWAIGGIMTIMSFMTAWLIRIQSRQNKISEGLAVNIESDTSREKEINGLKKDIRDLIIQVTKLNDGIVKWRTNDSKILVRMESQYGTIEEQNKIINQHKEEIKANNLEFARVAKEYKEHVLDKRKAS